MLLATNQSASEKQVDRKGSCAGTCLNNCRPCVCPKEKGRAHCFSHSSATTFHPSLSLLDAGKSSLHGQAGSLVLLLFLEAGPKPRRANHTTRPTSALEPFATPPAAGLVRPRTGSSPGSELWLSCQAAFARSTGKVSLDGSKSAAGLPATAPIPAAAPGRRWRHAHAKSKPLYHPLSTTYSCR